MKRMAIAVSLLCVLWFEVGITHAASISFRGTIFATDPCTNTLLTVHGTTDEEEHGE